MAREAFSIHNGEDHTADGIAIRTSPMIFFTGLDAIAVDESSRWFRLMSSRAETVSSYVREADLGKHVCHSLLQLRRDRGSPTSN